VIDCQLQVFNFKITPLSKLSLIKSKKENKHEKEKKRTKKH